MTLVNLRGHFT